MASLLLTSVPFPETTTLRAYRGQSWAGPPPEPGDAPRAPVQGSAGVVDAHGAAVITGLEYDTAYYVGGQVSGFWRWLSARTPTAPTGGEGGGGAGTVISVNGAAPDAGGDVELSGLGPLGALQASVVTSPTKLLGSVFGNLTLNLAEGRIFKGTAVAPLDLHAITGFVAGARVFFEVEIIGKNTIGFSFLKGWRYGGVPPLDLSSSSSVNSFMFFTDDGVNIYGVGVEPLPAAVAQIVGTPKPGDALVYDGTHWGPVPASTPLKSSDVEALIEQDAILNGGNEITVGGVPAAGAVPYTASPTAATWSDLDTLIGRLRPSTITTGVTTTIEGDRFYRITGIRPTLVLPNGVPQNEGTRIVIENASLYPVKVKGRFTVGSSTESVLEVQSGEVVTLVGDDEATLWRRISALNPQALSAGAVAGGFLAQTCDLPTSKAVMVTKTLHIAKIMVPSTLDVKELFVNVTKAGTLSAAYVALIDATGVLLAVTNDEHVAFESIGVKGMKIGAGEAPVPGGPGVFVWGVALCVATVLPELLAAAYGGEAKDINANVTASAVRVGEARNTAGETAVYNTIPLTVDPSKNRGKTTNFPLFWVAAA